jgi:hypothetical protein
MTGTEIYRRALDSLGYSDDQVFKNKAVVTINQIYSQLADNTGAEFKSIRSLADKIELSDAALISLVYGVAQRFALSEGDGELQQYFAREYDNSRARLTVVDKITTVF